MLASASTLHLERPVDHVMNTLFNGSSLFGVFTVVHDAFVKVSVSDVTKDTCKKAEVVHFLLGDFCSSFRQERKKRVERKCYRRVIPIMSGSREIGTATSVDQTSSPSRRSAIMLQSDSLRADQRVFCSSASMANSKSPLLLAFAIAFTSSMFSCT